jgi:hypothetical protein
MQPHARHSATEAEWTFVSAKSPCRICGHHNGCRSGFEGQFACCTRVSSQWPLSVGGWVHRCDEDAVPALDDLASVPPRLMNERSPDGAAASPPSP